MDKEVIDSIGTLVVGIGGAVAGVFGIYKGYVAQQNSANLKNFQTLYDQQQKQIDNLREEIGSLKGERVVLATKIDQLTENNRLKDIQIAELQGEVKGLRGQVEQNQSTLEEIKK